MRSYCIYLFLSDLFHSLLQSFYMIPFQPLPQLVLNFQKDQTLLHYSLTQGKINKFPFFSLTFKSLAVQKIFPQWWKCSLSYSPVRDDSLIGLLTFAIIVSLKGTMALTQKKEGKISTIYGAWTKCQALSHTISQSILTINLSSSINSPILQVRELSPRELMWLALGHSAYLVQMVLGLNPSSTSCTPQSRLVIFHSPELHCPFKLKLIQIE